MDWEEEEEDYISWKPTGRNDDAHDLIDDATSFLTQCLIPRPTAWIVVYPADDNEQQQEPIVSLVEGYCGASDRPPTLMLGSDSIPNAVLSGLRANGVCTLSVATERESIAAKQMSAHALPSLQLLIFLHLDGGVHLQWILLPYRCIAD